MADLLTNGLVVPVFAEHPEAPVEPYIRVYGLAADQTVWIKFPDGREVQINE